MFGPILAFVAPTNSNAPPLYSKIGAGLISGTIGALAVNPLDMLKTRMQAMSSATTQNWTSTQRKWCIFQV